MPVSPGGSRGSATDLHQGLARLTGAAENAIIDSFERGRALLQHLIWGSSETWAQLYYVPLSSILLPTRSGHGCWNRFGDAEAKTPVWQLSDLIAYCSRAETNTCLSN